MHIQITGEDGEEEPFFLKNVRETGVYESSVFPSFLGLVVRGVGKDQFLVIWTEKNDKSMVAAPCAGSMIPVRKSNRKITISN